MVEHGVLAAFEVVPVVLLERVGAADDPVPAGFEIEDQPPHPFVGHRVEARDQQVFAHVRAEVPVEALPELPGRLRADQKLFEVLAGIVGDLADRHSQLRGDRRQDVHVEGQDVPHVEDEPHARSALA